jgi:hypothetical protein
MFLQLRKIRPAGGSRAREAIKTFQCRFSESSCRTHTQLPIVDFRPRERTYTDALRRTLGRQYEISGFSRDCYGKSVTGCGGLDDPKPGWRRPGARRQRGRGSSRATGLRSARCVRQDMEIPCHRRRTRRRRCRVSRPARRSEGRRTAESAGGSAGSKHPEIQYEFFLLSLRILAEVSPFRTGEVMLHKCRVPVQSQGCAKLRATFDS